jgi:uncharacterized membrane protein (UPF0127 family)
MQYAKTYLQKAAGLMFRAKPPDGGLLMVFRTEGCHGIWMPFMRFPIDIAFYGKNSRLISTIRNAEPISLNPKTWRVYRPERPCKYILETAVGAKKPKKLPKSDTESFINP